MDDMLLAKIMGDKIKKLRRSHNLKQSELAEMLGFTQQYLSAIETGRRVVPTETLIEICAALNVPLGYFELSIIELIKIGAKIIVDILAPEHLIEVAMEQGRTREEAEAFVEEIQDHGFSAHRGFWEKVVESAKSKQSE